MKFRLFVFAAALLWSGVVFGQTPLASAHSSSNKTTAPAASSASMKPAVRVNGMVLTEADVVREMYTIFPYASQHGGFPKPMEADIRKGAIDMIVFEELLYQEAQRLKVSIAPDQLSRAEAEFRKQLGAGEYEKFLRTECRGSKQVLLEKIRRSLLIDKMLKTEVEQKSVVTPAEVKAYYEKNSKQFENFEGLRIQTISIIPPQNSGAAVEKEARKKAEEAYKLAKQANGFREFGLLAERISDDDWHVNMGDRSFVAVSQLPPPIVKAAESMKPGEISNLIQLGNAYTIFRLVEHVPAGKKPFEAVKDRLQSDLQKQKRAGLRASLNQRLRKNAQVQVL